MEMLKQLYSKIVLCHTCLILFLSALVLTSSQLSGNDDTRKEGTSGAEVVEATVDQIPNEIFPHKAFLRRLAYVESTDGLDPMTYRYGYHGGIWQVDQEAFLQTKNTASNEDLQLMSVKINEALRIEWQDVTWGDLRKPLYSAIAAVLFLSITSEEIPSDYDISGQASFWKQHYDTPDGSGTEQEFISAVGDLETNLECRTGRLDIAFVMDGSGSVELEHFEKAKDFVSGIVAGFSIGSNAVRVGVIQYEDVANREFLLNQYTTKESLLSAIANISYISGGGTQTGRAMNFLVDDLFAPGNGARDLSENVPRIGIVMTDGQSGDQVFEPAETARAAGITMFAIGIGPSIEEDELIAIANDPDEKCIFQVGDFELIDNIRSLVTKVSCNEPVEIKTNQSLSGELTDNSEQHLKTTLPQSGMTFSMNTTVGKATAFLSTVTCKPSEAFHQWRLEMTQENPFAQVFIIGSMSGSPELSTHQSTGAELTLCATIVSTVNVKEHDVSETDSASETVFTVMLDEGDTRIGPPHLNGRKDNQSNEIAGTALSAGIIAGIAIAALLVFGIVCVVVQQVIKHTRGGKTISEETPNTEETPVIEDSMKSAEMRNLEEKLAFAYVMKCYENAHKGKIASVKTPKTDEENTDEETTCGGMPATKGALKSDAKIKSKKMLKFGERKIGSGELSQPGEESKYGKRSKGKKSENKPRRDEKPESMEALKPRGKFQTTEGHALGEMTTMEEGPKPVGIPHSGFEPSLYSNVVRLKLEPIWT